MKLTPELKEIALRVAGELDFEVGYPELDKQYVAFVEAFLAALPKPEPVAYRKLLKFEDGSEEWKFMSFAVMADAEPLYPYPPATSEQPVQFPFMLDKQTAKFVNREIKYEEKIKELEAQLIQSKAQWEKESIEADRWSDKCAELEAQNATLLVVIEKMRESISRLANHGDLCSVFCLDEDDRHMPCDCGLSDALAISPSAELLEARDRKRDTALLMLVAEDFSENSYAYLLALANRRESGEWRPELGE